MDKQIATPSRLLRTLVSYSRRVWLRVKMIAVLAIIAAASVPLLERAIPAKLADRLGVGAIRSALSILATSMPAVTTLSLSVIVTAHRAASDSVMPGAHGLLQPIQRRYWCWPRF